jgi:hypothetical protein
MIDSARFRHSSFGNSSDFQFSKKESNEFSFEEDRPSSVLRRNHPASLLNNIESLLKEALDMKEELTHPSQLLKQVKNAFLKVAEREADREIHEKVFEIDRVRENLEFLVNELNSNKNALNDPALKEGLKEQLFTHVREKVQKAGDLIEDQKNKCLCLELDLEIVPKSVLKDTKDKIRSLQIELERLKMQNTEFTPDTARLHQKPGDSEMIEEVDDLICSRIKDLQSLIQTFSTSSPSSLSLVSKSPEFDPNYPLRCFDSFRALEGKILTLLRSFSPSNQSDHYEDHSGLKSLIQALSQENLSLKQKLASSKANENDLSLIMRNKELSFEEKISDIREQTQFEMTKMQEYLEQLQEEGNFKSKITQLEEELKEAQDSARKTDHFERELKNVRKIYNDKYEELFRITSAQISELELKLKEKSFEKQRFVEDLKNSVRREENKVKELEISRINQIHSREIRLVQAEYQDFLSKSRVEILKLGKLVEKAIKTSDYKLMTCIQEDIHNFHSRVESQANRVKDESFSLAYDEKICKRCGMTDKTSRFCTFHPFLVGSDAQDFLYSKEWHKCREDRHQEGTKGCLQLSKHIFHQSSQTFLKMLENDPITFRSQNEKIDSQSRTLQEALFSTEKKKTSEVSASDLLDSYLAKYAN